MDTFMFLISFSMFSIFSFYRRIPFRPTRAYLAVKSLSRGRFPLFTLTRGDVRASLTPSYKYFAPNGAETRCPKELKGACTFIFLLA